MCATHLLKSMGKRHLPSRAEMLDVANAILDGSDCLQLSEEVVDGVDPMKCLKMISKICKEAEAAVYQSQLYQNLSSTVSFFYISGLVRVCDSYSFIFPVCIIYYYTNLCIYIREVQKASTLLFYSIAVRCGSLILSNIVFHFYSSCKVINLFLTSATSFLTSATLIWFPVAETD